MNLDQAKILIENCSGLTGKTIQAGLIAAVFICDSNRQNSPEIIDNVVNNQAYLNEAILANHTSFDVMVLSYMEDHRHVVQHLGDVLSEVFHGYRVQND